MNSQPIPTASGFPFATILGLIFITLKLTKLITWSWWWVLSPFWISFVVAFVLALIVVLTEAPSRSRNG